MLEPPLLYSRHEHNLATLLIQVALRTFDMPITLPMTDTVSILNDVCSYSGQLLRILGQPEMQSSSEVTPPMSAASAHSERGTEVAYELRKTLSSKQLAPRIVDELCLIFDNAATRWDRQFFERTDRLFRELSPVRGLLEEGSSLQRAVSVTHYRGLSILKQALIRMVDEKVSAFFSETTSNVDDNAAQSGITGRGHQPEVIAVLEKAFGHTQNITQAEKKRLAELTGLEPRQVVIW